MDVVELFIEKIKEYNIDLSFDEVKTTNDRGFSIALELAIKGCFFENKSIQKIATTVGYTVAHEMARHGYIFQDHEILKLSTNTIGFSVAHTMARNGAPIEDSEILALETLKGKSVKDYVVEHTHVGEPS